MKDVEVSYALFDCKAPTYKTELVRKRILDKKKKGTSLQSEETQNSPSLEVFDVDSFWQEQHVVTAFCKDPCANIFNSLVILLSKIEEKHCECSLSSSHSFSLSCSITIKKEAQENKHKSNYLSTIELDSFW